MEFGVFSDGACTQPGAVAGSGNIVISTNNVSSPCLDFSGDVGQFGAEWALSDTITFIINFYEQPGCFGGSTNFLVPPGTTATCEAIANIDGQFLLTNGVKSMVIYAPFDQSTS